MASREGSRSVNTPQPLYDATTVDPAYRLHYSWTGWVSGGKFDEPQQEILESIKPLWERDGLRPLYHQWTEDRVQVLFSATPSISPELLAQRAKGRLDHALRKHGCDVTFNRKFGLRSIGENTRSDVEAYIENQVAKAQFVDPRFESRMRQFTIVEPVDLSLPTETHRGRYWYDLHVVLTAASGLPTVSETRLTRLRDSSLAVAAKHGHKISRLSVMPDHWHAALRGNPTWSPAQIVDTFQNNLAYALGQERIWRDTYYVATFGDYNMDAIEGLR